MSTLSKKEEKEKRKYVRSDCLLPAEFVKSEGRDSLSERAIVHSFSQEGLKLAINFMNIRPGSKVEVKIFVPEKNLSTTLAGEVTWNKFKDNKLEVGLKINKMDENVKEEILNWIMPVWVKIEDEKKEKKEKSG